MRFHYKWTHRTPLSHDLRDHGSEGFCTRVEDMKGVAMRKPTNGLRNKYTNSYHMSWFDNENHYH